MRKKSHGQALKQTNGYHDMILPDTIHFFKADLQCPWRSFGWWPYETTMDDGRSPRIPVAHPLGASPWRIPLASGKQSRVFFGSEGCLANPRKKKDITRHHKTLQDITRHYKTSRHNQLISMETYWGLTTFTRYLSINQQGLKFILHSSTSRILSTRKSTPSLSAPLVECCTTRKAPQSCHRYATCSTPAMLGWTLLACLNLSHLPPSVKKHVPQKNLGTVWIYFCQKCILS